MRAEEPVRACVRAYVRVLAVTEWKLTPFSAAGAERVGVKVEDMETLKTHPELQKTRLAL